MIRPLVRNIEMLVESAAPMIPIHFVKKNGRQDVKDSTQEINLCTEAVLPLDLQNAKPEILRQIDRKWKHNDNCNPIGFFVAFSDPQQQKFTPENDEAG